MNEIDDYLRANRDAYTREALTKRLVEEGHDPAAVDAAWARITGHASDRWAEGDPPIHPPTGKAGIGTLFLILTAICTYGGAIFLAGIAISFGGGISVLMIVYIVAMLFGLVYTVRRLLSAPKRGSGFAPIFGAAAVAIVIFVGLSGACLAAIGPVTNLTGTRLF
jgi:hypothetical protein